MGKPIKKYPTQKMYNFRECRDYIDEKYDIKQNDFYNAFGSDIKYSKSVRYYNFWHFFSERYVDGNESVAVMYESDIPDTFPTNKIAQMYIDEFGNDDGAFVCWVDW